MSRNLYLLSALLLGLVAGPAQSAEMADAIYLGGPIVTVDDKNPNVEAVAVKGGKIVAVGKKDDVLKLKGDGTKVIDLKGKSLLPGFIDSHGHTYMIGIQATTANLLPPPDGPGKDIPSIVMLLRDWAKNNEAAVEKVGWIAGFGYDDSQLAEQRHPTRDELDDVSKDLPVVIVHQSGHLGVANSAALKIAGITAETKDPKGGVFRRKEGSTEPNGVCEEYAFFAVMATRVAHLKGTSTGGLNGTYQLTSSTVQKDTSVDLLTGNSGLDWYFANLVDPYKDTLSDQSAGEIVN